MIYEKLLEEAERENLYVIENAHFQSKACGLINNDVIGINKNVRTFSKRNCILAEEIGHSKTTVGNILNQSLESNRKQELKARMWAYNKLIGLRGIVDCYNAGCQNTYEMAETLNVTEDFLLEALFYYKEKYGVCAQIDNYIVYFSPNLGVYKIR